MWCTTIDQHVLVGAGGTARARSGDFGGDVESGRERASAIRARSRLGRRRRRRGEVRDDVRGVDAPPGRARPSTSGYTVRSASCRSITSATARRSASASSVPVSRTRDRDVVRRRRRVEPVEEPHPLLRQRQRHPSGPRPRRPGRGRVHACGARRSTYAASSATVGASNSSRTPTSESERRVDAARPPASRQRVAAEVEEVVVDTDRARRRAPRRRPSAIGSSTGRRSAPGTPRPRQRTAVRAAPRGRACRPGSAGSRRAPRRARAPCTPAAGSATLPQQLASTSIGRPAPGRRRTTRTVSPVGPGRADGARESHVRMRGSTASISPSSMRKPAHLHLEVGAAQVLAACRSGRPPHQVAGAVHPLAAAPNGSATNRSAVSPGRR